jgi:hypothetical protein
MRESFDGDEKISQLQKQLFFCCNPSIFLFADLLLRMQNTKA